MLKKFKVNTQFADYQEGNYTQKVEWTYPGDRGPGMETISFHSSLPFAVEIGLRLEIAENDIDYYGFTKSRYINGEYVTTVSTYLDQNPVKFVFVFKKENDEQQIARRYSMDKPDVVYPPHPWQNPWIWLSSITFGVKS